MEKGKSGGRLETAKSKWVKVAQSCLTLCDPMDYTVHGILQARILEWAAFPFSRGSSQPRDRTQVLHIRWNLDQLSHKGSPRILEWVAYPSSSRSSRPRHQTRVSCIAGRFFTTWAMREAWRELIVIPNFNRGGVRFPWTSRGWVCCWYPKISE